MIAEGKHLGNKIYRKILTHNDQNHYIVKEALYPHFDGRVVLYRPFFRSHRKDAVNDKDIILRLRPELVYPEAREVIRQESTLKYLKYLFIRDAREEGI